MSKKKLLNIFITQMGHPNFRGGGNIIIHNLSEELAKRGHKVSVIYLAPKNLLSNIPKTGYNVILKKSSKIPLFNALTTLITMKKILGTNGKPDVIITAGYEGFFIPFMKKNALFIAASYNPALRYISPKDFFQLKWLNPLNFGKFLFIFSLFMDRLTTFKADLVQCLSPYSIEQCVRIYKIPRSKLFVALCGINAKQFSLRPMPKNKTILFVGGTVEYKGLDILINALPAVVNKHPDIELIVVGEMKERKEMLMRLAKKIGVFSKINWHGPIPPDHMAEFFQKAYVAVFPSRIESFLLAALEAMSSGVPIVATDVGIIPEIINDKINGLMVKQENPKNLAMAINYLLDNPEKAKEIGIKGRETIINGGFTWENFAKKIEEEIYTYLNNSITQ